MRKFLEYQILTDFIITNTDRHFNNFGVLRDADILKYAGIAPIFDSGNSMLWNRRSIPEKEKLKTSLYSVPVTSFKKTETELLKYVTNFEEVDLSIMPSDDSIIELLGKDDMNQQRLSGLMEWYHAKVDIINQLQLGKKLEEIAEKKYLKRPGLTR